MTRFGVALVFALGLALGALLHGVLADRPACPDRGREVEALARAFTEQALVLEDIHRGCVWLPRSESLGVVKVRRR